MKEQIKLYIGLQIDLFITLDPFNWTWLKSISYGLNYFLCINTYNTLKQKLNHYNMDKITIFNLMKFSNRPLSLKFIFDFSWFHCFSYFRNYKFSLSYELFDYFFCYFMLIRKKWSLFFFFFPWLHSYCTIWSCSV